MPMNTLSPPLPASLASPLEPEIERDLLRAYIDSADDGIFVVCDEMKLHVANPRLQAWLGISEAELIAHGRRVPVDQLFGVAETARQFRTHFDPVLRGQPVRFEAEMRPPRGDARWLEISMNRVQIDSGQLVVGILRDVTERRALQRALQHHASHDDLTGLANRREFQQRLVRLVDAARRDGGQHALIYVDLDQFKVVNDTCGHSAGDELLRQLGRRLRETAGPGDLIARLGGDEFGLLLADRAVDAAMDAAHALCATVARQRFALQGRIFEVTASVGVCAIDKDAISAEEVLSSADAACYVAKDEGRNRAQLYLGDTTCTDKRQEMGWVSRLHRALEEDRFEIWQQRIVDLEATPDDAGDSHVELLLRLIDEDGGIVAPCRFLTAAERYGLMPAIDRWVIGHLLLGGRGSGLHGELARHPRTHFGINLSGASLNDDKFLEFVEDALQRTAVPGAALCFEITETVAIANFARVSEVMARLKQFGCRFALDDFGSGMSSFSYLKHLPVDSLKIDGTLVRNIVVDAADRAMVDAINRVGHALGLRTVAEFVEAAPTLDALRAIGVDFAQGDAIHRPEPLLSARATQAARNG
jgi:diguanylate cyclase (GGDEF)-like protein/PAS domain S-box-containing protein